MHMWMWSGYNLGEFLFSGLVIDTRWAFGLTWIVLFFVAVLFEGSKVYLAQVQREAHNKLYPYRSDERRTLLCDREQGNLMEPTTSRNASTGQVSRWASFRVRTLVNSHQSLVFLAHNVVGYLLMLAVMLYNVHLLLAVVFGMMLADNTTPPHLESGSETDMFICQTRTCIQPSHYFPSSSSEQPTCYYGAAACPSRVARAKKMQATPGTSHCHHAESEKEDTPSVEDVQLLRTERQGCCKKKQEPPPEVTCCKSTQDVVVHEPDEESIGNETRESQEREDSPQVTCCHNTKTPSESQEQIM
ncbi:uncharacterized protein LOC131850350 isoform X2 [Achroia grisella]|uniref:uncharacterized protein LOC131850350 isoform X2 n=1 Tax=Achroia grisella TaxID=688607 RepID=UPI0027D29180|nr:uncharacterized protein LOC131850350 isoform X2 [Achroia grisella]